ncbi:7880_t:CDS:2 [Ambispora gerdemannii]|uniref:7880_t:CDS:1 n=1 Tax=Ambispora gerdemannii TaxID=144530 RepID=A0A9N9BTA7_9GLOM|nr:7880_t:CDS:2 [Ambispora gerdemannii]
MSFSKLIAAFTVSAAVEPSVPTKPSSSTTKSSGARPQPTASTASTYKLSPTTQVTDNNIVITSNDEFSCSKIGTNAIVTSPPSPDATVPLWTEQVDADTKKKMDSETIRRQEVMFEIIRTEKEFVDDLQYLLDHYVTAIQGSRIRLPNSLVHTFSVLLEIYYMHRNISRQLLNTQAIYRVVPSITDALVALVGNINKYDKYLLYHKTAISELANARKKGNKLGQLVKTLESHVMTGRYRSLESLLAKPIQRLCKYPLLVMTLLRVTPKSAKELDIRIDHEQLRKLHDELDHEIRSLQERNERAKKEENLKRRINGLGSKCVYASKSTSQYNGKYAVKEHKYTHSREYIEYYHHIHNDNTYLDLQTHRSYRQTLIKVIENQFKNKKMQIKTINIFNRRLHFVCKIEVFGSPLLS